MKKFSSREQAVSWNFCQRKWAGSCYRLLF